MSENSAIPIALSHRALEDKLLTQVTPHASLFSRNEKILYLYYENTSTFKEILEVASKLKKLFQYEVHYEVNRSNGIA